MFAIELSNFLHLQKYDDFIISTKSHQIKVLDSKNSKILHKQVTVTKQEIHEQFFITPIELRKIYTQLHKS